MTNNGEIRLKGKANCTLGVLDVIETVERAGQTDGQGGCFGCNVAAIADSH